VDVNHVARDEYWERRGLWLLWFSVFAAPAAWAFDQGLSFVLVPYACASNSSWLLTGISASALALVVAGGLVGHACWRRAAAAAEDGSSPRDRSYFLAMVGVGFNILVALLIVFATIPQFVLHPCE
jgi:hypothetical protein